MGDIQDMSYMERGNLDKDFFKKEYLCISILNKNIKFLIHVFHTHQDSHYQCAGKFLFQTLPSPSGSSVLVRHINQETRIFGRESEGYSHMKIPDSKDFSGD